MNGQITLETSAQIIGGDLGRYPRQYGPVVETYPTAPDACWFLRLDPATGGPAQLEVEFRDWTDLSDGWVSVRMALRNMSGYQIGKRPALIYDRPYDMPTSTQFYYPPAGCTFVVLTRRYS